MDFKIWLLCEDRRLKEKKKDEFCINLDKMTDFLFDFLETRFLFIIFYLFLRVGVMCEINHFLQEVETDLNHASQVFWWVVTDLNHASQVFWWVVTDLNHASQVLREVEIYMNHASQVFRKVERALNHASQVLREVEIYITMLVRYLEKLKKI